MFIRLFHLHFEVSDSNLKISFLRLEATIISNTFKRHSLVTMLADSRNIKLTRLLKDRRSLATRVAMILEIVLPSCTESTCFGPRKLDQDSIGLNLQDKIKERITSGTC